MNTHSQDIRLFRAHLDVFKNAPLSLVQEGAIQQIEADLVTDDLFVENIEQVKIHLGIVLKYPLTEDQRRAGEWAVEIAVKISLSKYRK